ncbi:MAG: glycosyltransferase family 39 protein [Anaerolineae bacterium]|jgi:hypothetical protein|nr:glycosyltransferase family 39 protein [Anaerolineae bacterium]
MTKNSRISFIIAVGILLLGGFYRLIDLDGLPPGLSGQEVIDLRLAENVRQGTVQVFFDIGGEGREILYPSILAAYTGLMGSGLVIYQMLSFWVGLLTVALVFAVTRRLYGDLAGLGAMGVMAFGWWPMLLSRTTGRETLLPLLIALALLALVLALPTYLRRRTGSFQTTWFAVIAAVLGLGIYLHPAGAVVALAALVILIGYYVRGVPRPTPSVQRATGFTWVILIILTVPYVVTSINSPELSGIARVVNGLTIDPTSLPERVLRAVLGLGVLGDVNPAYNPLNRPLFDPLTAVIALVGVGVALRGGARLRYSVLATFIVFLLPLGLLAPNSPSWIAFSAPIVVLAVCYGLGVSFIAHTLRRRRLAYLIVGGSLVFNALWLGVDVLGGWGDQPDTRAAYNARVAELAARVDATADDLPTLICTGDALDPSAQSSINAARLLGLMQHRPEQVRAYLDCSNGMIFPNGGEPMQLVITDPSLLETASSNVLDWLARGTGSATEDVLTLEVVQPLADRIGLLTTTAPLRLSPEADPTGTTFAPPVRLGNNLTFLGYETQQTRVAPGGTFAVVTYWRVDGVLPTDLMLFAHLYDDLGAPPVANRDLISAVPVLLQERDILMQVHLVSVPDTLPERAYTLAVGAYRQQTGERLPVLQGEGLTPRGSRLILYPIEITTEP